MTRHATCLSVLGLAALANGCTSPSTTQTRYVDAFEQAGRAATTFIPATKAVRDLDLSGAYSIQHQIVTRQLKAGDAVAGYKSSLMSAKSLADRKAGEPLVGVLFKSGAANSGNKLRTCGYRRPVLEMKLGFTFAQAVQRTVPSIAALKSMVQTVVPVVELPDIAYADDKTYIALDMVAANISSARFVQGQPHSPSGRDLDSLAVSIARDGAVLTRGRGSESLDGQWPSLLLTVNLLIKNGYSIEPGQFVLTGKIGDKLDVRPGFYQADYGPLGIVDFNVDACQ